MYADAMTCLRGDLSKAVANHGCAVNVQEMQVTNKARDLFKPPDLLGCKSERMLIG